MTSRKRFLLLPSALLCASVAMAQTVPPTSIFELDGNSADSGGCDWDTLNPTSGTDTNTPKTPCGPTINAYVFINGSTDEKNFHGGGSKDPIDIHSWRWANTSSPD